MGRKAKLKAINREIASAVSQYEFAVHDVYYSKDNSYAVLYGIEKGGTPRICVIAPGGMEPEKMEHISAIAARTFKATIANLLTTKELLGKTLQT